MGFSGLAIYALGIACIIRSIMAFSDPQAEYALNGLRHTVTSKDDPSSGPIYMLGTWELSVGVLLLIYQMRGNITGITTLLSLMSIYKTGVAVLIWRVGEEDKLGKVTGNAVTAIVLSLWALYKGS